MGLSALDVDEGGTSFRALVTLSLMIYSVRLEH